MLKQILLNIHLDDEPNNTKLTAIEMGSDKLCFHQEFGFVALDIYNLLTGKGEKDYEDEAC